jgi:hypothetical protein
MSRQRIALAALVAALLSGIALMTLFPSSAQATQRWNDIYAWKVSPYPFDYTWEWRGHTPGIAFRRNKTDPGPMRLRLTNNVTNGICVMAKSLHGRRLGLACWLPGEYGIKTMSYSVPAQRFILYAARRGSRYTSSNARWDGMLYY